MTACESRSILCKMLRGAPVSIHHHVSLFCRNVDLRSRPVYVHLGKGLSSHIAPCIVWSAGLTARPVCHGCPSWADVRKHTFDHRGHVTTHLRLNCDFFWTQRKPYAVGCSMWFFVCFRHSQIFNLSCRYHVKVRSLLFPAG